MRRHVGAGHMIDQASAFTPQHQGAQERFSNVRERNSLESDDSVDGQEGPNEGAEDPV